MNGPTPRADALVLFGLTGDLGSKKLFPAIYELAVAGELALPVIGVGRSERSDREIREMFLDALDGYEPTDDSEVDRSVVDTIDLSYLQGDSTDSAVYDELARRLAACSLPVVYAALPPDIFGSVAEGIRSGGLPDATRLVLEKPFGDGAGSARKLWNEITALVPADQLFIVDHFLAKASIENILTVRTRNPLVANSLDARHVESIEIVMHEAGGVDGRGSFYEGVGAIKDVVQNHLMQLLAMLTMEAPADDSDGAFHQARHALLEAVEPVAAADALLGQYDGYRDLDDVADDSDVETFVALDITIDSDRWRGTPITIRTGKRLDESRTEATFHLRADSSGGPSHPNRIRFMIKPEAAVGFDLGVIDPDTHEPTTATAYACGPSGHGPLGDYAVMFDNAMRGDDRHFAQIDDILASWRILTPVLVADHELHIYEPGSAGPSR